MKAETQVKHLKISRDVIAVNILGIIVIGLFALICLFPFYLIIVASFTNENALIRNGFPIVFQLKNAGLEAYKLCLKAPGDIINAYLITGSATIIGTCLSVLISTMTGYVLSRKDFPWRNKFSFYFFFTTLFSGGLVPWYVFNTKYLHFHNNLIALILPILVNVTYLLILKSYMMNIPDSLYESARLDGAGDFTIYWRIVMPLTKSGLATVGLFIALAYWNDWYNAMLYMDEGSRNLYPLQYFLNNILTKAQAMNAAAARSGIPASDVPSEPMKLAMTVVATGPIVLLYPFLQKFFVKGVTIGAVKG